MDSCVCEKAVTTTQLAHCRVDLYKILGGKWETCPPQGGYRPPTYKTSTVTNINVISVILGSLAQYIIYFLA